MKPNVVFLLLSVIVQSLQSESLESFWSRAKLDGSLVWAIDKPINLSALKSWVCIANSTTLWLRILDAATNPESIPPGFPLKFNIIAAAKGLVQTLLQCCFALKAYMIYVKYNIGRSSAYNSYLCHYNVYIYIIHNYMYMYMCMYLCMCMYMILWYTCECVQSYMCTWVHLEVLGGG